MATVTLEGLRALLDPLDAAPVECDGMARLVVTRLVEAGIEHRAFLGWLALGERVVQPHFWVEVGPWRIDYRAAMWLGGGPDVPHGIVPLDGPCQYVGRPIVLAPLPPALFELLSQPPSWPETWVSGNR